MASVEKRVRDGKVTWLARWRDPDGRQRKQSFRRKSDAERFLTGVEHSQLTGAYVNPDAGRMTIGELGACWLSQLQIKPSTTARYESLLRVHVLPAWGTTPLRSVTDAEVATWVAALGQRALAPSSGRRVR